MKNVNSQANVQIFQFMYSNLTQSYGVDIERAYYRQIMGGAPLTPYINIWKTIDREIASGNVFGLSNALVNDIPSPYAKAGKVLGVRNDGYLD